MDNQTKHMEELIEKSLDTVTSNPVFLNAISLMININSYRRIFVKKTLEALWKDLELPGRQEQQKLLQTIEELNIRIRRMEIEAKGVKTSPNQKSEESISVKSSPVTKPSRREKLVSADVDFQ